MTDSNSSRSSRLFLIELIMAILFFSLGSAVCIQAFARAHTVSSEARDLAFASATVSGAANVVRFTDGSLEAFQTYYPEAEADGAGFAVCFDADFSPCGREAAAYILRVETERDGGVTDANIRMEDPQGGSLYALSLRYPGDGGGAAG